MRIVAAPCVANYKSSGGLPSRFVFLTNSFFINIKLQLFSSHFVFLTNSFFINIKVILFKYIYYQAYVPSYVFYTFFVRKISIKGAINLLFLYTIIIRLLPYLLFFTNFFWKKNLYCRGLLPILSS